MYQSRILAFAFAFIFTSVCQAKDTSHPSYLHSVESREADLTTHRHYKNRDGDEVHSPSQTKSRNAPAGASAQCRDGSFSFSRHHRGTCSRHGGVDLWLR